MGKIYFFKVWVKGEDCFIECIIENSRKVLNWFVGKIKVIWLIFSDWVCIEKIVIGFFFFFFI